MEHFILKGGENSVGVPAGVMAFQLGVDRNIFASARFTRNPLERLHTITLRSTLFMVIIYEVLTKNKRNIRL